MNVWAKSLTLIASLGGMMILSNLRAAQNESRYVVGGIRLGQPIDQKNLASYFRCEPSTVFKSSTLCARTRQEDGSNGQYNDRLSVLQGESGNADYLERVIDPAYFKPQEITQEVARLSKANHQKPNIIEMPTNSDALHAVIAVWGDANLRRLDADSIRLLAQGKDPKKGVLIDFLGDLKRSAQQALPIYVLSGGAGMVWSARLGQNGKGVLRFAAIDASKLSLIAQPQAAIETPRAVAPAGGGGGGKLASDAGLVANQKPTSAARAPSWIQSATPASAEATGGPPSNQESTLISDIKVYGLIALGLGLFLFLISRANSK